MSQEIDVVIPVGHRDLERAKILLASIDRFWKVPGIVHIVCHPDIMTRASTELDLKNHRHMVMVETY